MEAYLKTIVESGGAVALAVVVWSELRALRKDLVASLENVSAKQQRIAEQQTVFLERQEHAKEDAKAVREEIRDDHEELIAEVRRIKGSARG